MMKLVLKNFSGCDAEVGTNERQLSRHCCANSDTLEALVDIAQLVYTLSEIRRCLRTA